VVRYAHCPVLVVRVVSGKPMIVDSTRVPV
jgi:hypothetical protein